MKELLKKAKEKMQKSVDNLSREFASIRAGRASTSVLDKVKVDYYGAPSPINQLAAVSVSEGRTLIIQPWDISTLNLIEKAIQKSDIGINPTNDGKVIRLTFPQPTEEKRKAICKDIKKLGEDAKVAVRNSRRDALDKVKAMKKNGEATDDEIKTFEKDIQKETDKFCADIDAKVTEKEKEVMSI